MSDDWTTGLDLYRAERFEEALPYLERASRTPDEDGGAAVRGPALSHLGMTQYVLGRYDDAVATFRAAILQMPGKARLHYNLGNSLLAVGRSADAKRQYEQALILDPGYEEATKAIVAITPEDAKPSAPLSSAPHSLAPSVREPAVPAPARPEPRSEARPSATEGQESRGVGIAPTDFARNRQRMEELEAQLRTAREALVQTRVLLERQEQNLSFLVEELLAAVRAYTANQEAAIREAAIQQAQTLLSQAAARPLSGFEE